MPELPEVQQVRQSLARRVLGRTVTHCTLRRLDVLVGPSSPRDLLQGQTLTDIIRHGKQLALLTTPDGPCLNVHLGMTGSLRYYAPAAGLFDELLADKHVHILWKLDDGGAMAFRDPRRFGGVWSFPNLTTLQAQRWSLLGPDALAITPKALHGSLSRTSRPIKAALLDQAVVAGLGNIYVDETLFTCRVHPLTPGRSLDLAGCQQLCKAFKAILKRAIASGGSTIRSYGDAEGKAGGFQKTLQVYGRSGQACMICQGILVSQMVIGRTTTFCQYCQAPRKV